MKRGTALLASGGQEFDFEELDKMPLEARLAFQQKQINEKLGFFITVAGSLVDSKDFMAPKKVEKKPAPAPAAPAIDSDLAKQIKELETLLADPSQSARQKNTARRKLKELKKKKETSSSPMSFLSNLPLATISHFKRVNQTSSNETSSNRTTPTGYQDCSGGS